MTTVVTRGAASAQALGYASSSAAVNYIEDVFSTYLYTGNGSTQTITNGIDLSGKGGLTWIKSRTTAFNHTLVDTVRGATNLLVSNTTAAQATQANSLTAFNSNGFSIGAGSIVNYLDDAIASWTFREQPKFFDVVTYTGNGAGSQPVAHNLGSAPGFILCKATSTSDNWAVYHRGNGTTEYTTLSLNLTTAAGFAGSLGTVNAATFNAAFVLDATGVPANASGVTYVAYLFAHNAGGFGLTGTDNVISCGSYTANSSGDNVTLGWEPQWLLFRRVNEVDPWRLVDNMRGWTTNNTSQRLQPNNADAEDSFGNMGLTATGFKNSGIYNTNDPVIYIAIRRGPMKVPTDATKVFSPQALNSPANGTQVTTGFPVDLSMFKARAGGPSGQFQDRLRGLPSTAGTGTPALYPDATAAESTNQTGYEFWNTGYRTYTAQNAVWWMFRRAPGFFDEVCYTGTGSATTVTHNLGVAPEFIQVKCRSNANGWMGYSAPTGNTKYINFADVDSAQVSSTSWNNTSPTSSVFTVGTDNSVNGSARTYVAYLFATVAGVSKVGSYTGNGTTQTIDCGFGAGGVRFVLIKRTDSTGNWYVYDTARGMTVLTDPYLLLNTTAAETATLGSVTTVSTGFALNSAILAAINVNAGSYIFLAIA